MAEIKPFRAWRYNEGLSLKIDDLTSPLFDVVSERQLRSLYQNPLNSIHLSVPMGGAAASDNAAATLASWKASGVIEQDPLPGIYVYYQYFKVAGSPRSYCRKGFVCNIRAYDWEDNVILRHENTMPRSVNDRIELLERTQLNVSPTHGLYTDQSFALEKDMDEAITRPIFETEDYQGVRDVLAVIHDRQVVNKFVKLIAEKQIILADGHHRYEGSLVYKKKSMAANPGHKGDEGYNFHMMYLTNTESGDFQILPTHRLIDGFPGFSEQSVVDKLKDDFIVTAVEDPYTVDEVIAGKTWTFGILFAETAYKVTLRQESSER